MNWHGSRRTPALLGSIACGTLGLLGSTALAGSPSASYRDRPAEDEIIYFLLPDRFANGDRNNDRGGLSGDRLLTGFDPTDARFYHGGDLEGLTAHLDYIRGLGATAVWLAPVFKNKPVQISGGHASAGYHGYWITDFTRVDPHFGTEAQLHQLVDAVHARGMKVYLDIVVNHTADVIRYRECPTGPCPYRSRADYPYTRKGGVDHEPINPGFLGDSPPYQTDANFARLTQSDYAYTPFVPAGEEHAKVPDWLNDPIYYHNRGDSTFDGESVTYGDFSGLDDLMTENPRVLRGFIEIYGQWIDAYGIDGFRIDTARHVNPEFWQAFVPAMRTRAAARGIPNFHIFGEVATATMDPGLLAQYTRVDGLPAVLDFAFAVAVHDTVAGNAGTEEFARLFAADALYEGGAAAAMRLPTFISNHDAGRLGYFIHRARPNADAEEVLKRVELAHALLLTLRGVPVLYYGDEQGFAGDGGDAEARQDMFASQVPAYNSQARIGSDHSAATDSFDTHHPLYQAIGALAHLRQSHLALSHGLQLVRNSEPRPGLLAVSRFDPVDGHEILLAFNTSKTPLTAQVDVEPTSQHFAALHGHCESRASAPGSYRVRIPALDFIACESEAQP